MTQLPELVAICGIHEVNAEIFRTSATAVISILNPDADFAIAAPHNPIHLALRLLDVTDRHSRYAPSRKTIRTIVDFVEKLPAKTRLLVHCHAGISRSPAFAIGLSALSSTPQAAVETVRRLAPHCAPNKLIIELFDAELGLNGDLLSAAKARYPTAFEGFNERVKLAW